jgi:enoyl-[acyl-carrier protein] reductase I
VRPLAESIGAELVLPCDVAEDEQVAELFRTVQQEWDGLDILIHSVAFANREDLEGRFVDTTRAGFLRTLEISTFSFVDLVRHAEPMLTASAGCAVTMSYYGAEKAVPNYNVMGVAKAALEASVRYLASELGPNGVRINAISAGPIKTLAASGVRNFRKLMAYAEEHAPLRRGVTQQEVGQAALFLCSELGSGITGEIMHVDAGYNVRAM